MRTLFGLITGIFIMCSGCSGTSAAGGPPPATPIATEGDCASTSPGASYDAGLVNWAREGSASQSSTGHFSWDATPDLAIDGNRDGNYWAHSTSHTMSDHRAWWQVDLGQARPVTKIVIWNRTDCCAERLINFALLVTGSDGATVYERTFCSSATSRFSPAMMVDLPAGTVGSQVKIMLHDANYLQLAEVEVFGPQ